MIDAPTNIWATSIHAPLAVAGGVQSLSSYQFRVIEWTKNGISTGGVELQVKLTTHDQYGKILTMGPWSKVPRIKMES